MAHAPALLRTNTAPVFPANNNHFGGLPSSSGIGGSRVSQLSGSTAVNSSRMASPAPSISSGSLITPIQSSSNPVATANIINQQADASRSLYQICVALRQRLAQLPGFEPYLENLDQQSGEDDGPVESLWNLLRAGHPLLAIYNNSLQPADPLAVPPSPNEGRRTKLAIFKFVEACMKDLQIPPTQLFVVADLTGNDTTGLVKVTQVLNHVLDLAEQRGLLQQTTPYPDDNNGPAVPGAKMSTRDYILREMVNTERKYVQDLENLYDLKKTLEQKGAIPGDVVHQIFLNINAILDFQRRFLIRVETTNSLPAASQQWGNPFVTFEEAFNIYQPFIANQSKAAALAKQVFEKIQQTQHPVACDFNTLDGFLLKPMQRLVKYPLLLKDLLKDVTKNSDDPAAKADLSSGIESAERILKKANEAVERNVLDDALEELIGRVDDWKNHRVEQFGRLLRHGVYTVITGRSDQEKDYEIYLFEYILLCCKEINPNKEKSSKKDKNKSNAPKPRNKNNKLQLKGRIFMTNVTEVISFAKPGSYTVQIWWKGDPGVENFIIKFTNEEMMRKWATGLDTQRKENAPQSAASPDQPTPDFTWMRNVNNIENPYAQQDDDDEEDDDTTPSVQVTGTGNMAFGAPAPSTGGVMNRNASSTSLRARSGTNESTASLAGVMRAPPPRFPMPMPAPSSSLSLQTQGNGAPSPGHRGAMESYFSPTAESPASSRTSTASNLFHQSAQFPFPRTSTPQGGWEDNNRYTAPAMPRAPSRDGSSPVNAYGANGRNPRGPSMPVMASHSSSHSQSLAQQRNRSYSTPDINGPVNPRRTTNTTPVPAVPGIPSHLHPAHDSNIPRSQTGSPRQDLPVRTNTQSPGVQRERLQNGQGGTMAQFPSQPVHSRQPTPSQLGAPPSTANNQHPGSPPLGTASQGNPLSSPDLPIPTQLKVKIVCDKGNYVTLVVAFNITYQSLIDRIDAKLARFTNSSIGKGNLRLRYRDEDGDLVTIESDDDIQIAFLEWREGVRNMYAGGVGEIELFCQGDM